MTTAFESQVSDRRLFSGYRPVDGSYDELFDSDGEIRKHWRALSSNLELLGEKGCQARSAQINRRVRELGIAHDIFADPDNTPQPWNLDLVPFVISAGEWQWLAAALQQRARLYDAIVRDLYGEQQLMRRGSIPPEVVFSDPSFLPACHGIASQRGHLQFLAVDLARAWDGQWRVIDTHAETLAGLGFAVANRVVHMHFAGDLVDDFGPARFAPYFKRLQSELIARCSRPDPQIALLTSGPHHEDYFSHAYLARYMGLLLVEPGDLRVVGDRMHLKTLEGLRPIDLIVRCVEAMNADPLELNPAGFDGPDGLVQATRSNPDLLANRLGTAIVENRALGAYLPKLCQELLGETLSLDDAQRWWLGDEKARQEVLDTPATWILRQAHEGTGRPGRASFGKEFEHDASPGSKARMAQHIAGHGASMVAEEHLSFATTPSLSPEGLKPVPSAIRFFVARFGDDYEVLPGGLSMRVDAAKAVSLSADTNSRDVWVQMDDRTPPHTSLWRSTLERAKVDRSHRVLQSRVADNLYWLGRYAERADWTMRKLRGALRRLYEEDDTSADGLYAARISLARLLARDAPDLVPGHDVDDARAVRKLINLVLVKEGSGFGLPHTFKSLFQTAFATRDRLSLEAWHALNGIREKRQAEFSEDKFTPANDLQDYLDDTLMAIAAFNGFMHENMTRNFGWSFLDMGRRLERAYNLCDAIVGLFPQDPASEPETSELLLLLELADSYITYRSRYRLDPMLHLVLDLLMHDHTNPRSVAFQLNVISDHLKVLPQSKQGSDLTEERRLILSLHSAVQLFDNDTIAAHGAREKLHDLLSQQLEQLPRLSDAIMQRYFNPKEDTPHLARLGLK